MADLPTLLEFAALVAEMRDCQRRWFDRDTRTPEVLARSKQLERLVDRVTAAVLAPERTGSLPFHREGGAR